MQVGTSNLCPGEGRARSLFGMNVLRMKIINAELDDEGERGELKKKRKKLA